MNYTHLVSLLLRNPHLLRPNALAHNVATIHFHKLQLLGIRAIIFDRDNTLTTHLTDITPYSHVIHQTIQLFGQQNVAMLSNATIPNDLCCGLTVIKTQKRKPFNFQQVRRHFPADLRSHQICIIGDRLITDVALSNLNGCVSVLVKPLDVSSESIGIRSMRILESLYLSLYPKPIPHPVLGMIQV